MILCGYAYLLLPNWQKKELSSASIWSHIFKKNFYPTRSCLEVLKKSVENWGEKFINFSYELVPGTQRDFFMEKIVNKISMQGKKSKIQQNLTEIAALGTGNDTVRYRAVWYIR